VLQGDFLPTILILDRQPTDRHFLVDPYPFLKFFFLRIGLRCECGEINTPLLLALLKSLFQIQIKVKFNAVDIPAKNI
jgi:hypothetical protein